jgi:membrane-associated phospholipid phosphatase
MRHSEEGAAPTALALPRPSQRRVQALALAGLGAYLALTATLVGLRVEHLVAAAVCAALVLAGGRALTFIGLYLPVALTGVSYDLSRVTTVLRGSVHVADLYHAELALFGSGPPGAQRIPAAVLATRTHPALDLACGAAYLLYLYVPLVAAIALFFVDRSRMLAVGLAFLFTNLLGLALYLLYPAAPPWYVAKYGLGPALLDARPDAAGAARFDALLGIDYFAAFYARSPNVFGAMPSLHVGFPASTALALGPLGRRWWLPVALFTLLVAFAAVYLQHHYVLDVLAGLGCAACGVAGAELVIRRRRAAEVTLAA